MKIRRRRRQRKINYNLLIHHLNDLLILNIMIPRCSYDSYLLGVWEVFVSLQNYKFNSNHKWEGAKHNTSYFTYVPQEVLCFIKLCVILHAVSASYNLHFPQSFTMWIFSCIFQTTRIKMNCNRLGERKKKDMIQHRAYLMSQCLNFSSSLPSGLLMFFHIINVLWVRQQWKRIEGGPYSLEQSVRFYKMFSSTSAWQQQYILWWDELNCAQPVVWKKV